MIFDDYDLQLMKRKKLFVRKWDYCIKLLKVTFNTEVLAYSMYFNAFYNTLGLWSILGSIAEVQGAVEAISLWLC